MSPDVTTGPAPTPGTDDQDPFIADLNDIWAGNTLVLVGCGKAKRDPEDPVDVHEAAVGPDERMPGPGHTEETGPAWEAQDLYTSTYFNLKRGLAEKLTGVANPDHRRWSILSAEHRVVSPTHLLKPYDTTIDDLGDDPTNPDHRVSNNLGLRRPDGEPAVTETDQWARMVAASLCRWVAQFRPRKAEHPNENEMSSLLVLAGQSYVEPLRERGVFEYGIARQTGNPNEGWTFPLETRFLFEEIDAEGIGEQMAWLSDAVDRLDEVGGRTEQSQFDGGSR